MRYYLVRYRAEICLDIYADSKLEAEKKLDEIVLGLPNSFQVALNRLPHGSGISLEQENPA